MSFGGKLLLVIPPVIRIVNGVHEVDVDCANNLSLFLRNFSSVTLACPVSPIDKSSGILRSIPLDKLRSFERLSYIPLPYAYREDKYLRHYFSIRRLVRQEIMNADYLLFSPHAQYDWATLAALLAIKMGRKYDCESDWDHGNVQRLYLTRMPPGINKLRKTVWMYSFVKKLEKCLSHSHLALLQGQDVFDAYKDIAPNPHKVLNIQVTPKDYITTTQLAAKLERIIGGAPLIISYAGRMDQIKGPLDWLAVVCGAVRAGIRLHATWFGDGLLLPQMQERVAQLGLSEQVTLAGNIHRNELITKLHSTDIFLFCHKTRESPRCLSEALAAACPLVGYGTAHARDLVASNGGGEFSALDDWERLVEIIISLDRDRVGLGHFVNAAAASGRLLDRDNAMQRRIDLMKEHLAI